jgi:hypothetical protein
LKPSLEDLKKELKNRNIHLSYQRLSVLECLIQNRCHPTVDQIFTALHEEISTLSKTTVYHHEHLSPYRIWAPGYRFPPDRASPPGIWGHALNPIMGW